MEILYLLVLMGQGLLKRFSDKDLIEGIRCQDNRILNYVYKTYFQMVKNHVLKNGRDTSDVSEVLQESVIVLYKQICSDTLKLSTDLKGYFFGISRLVWSSVLRQKQKHSDLLIDMADETDAPYESDNLIMERIVARAMDKLKPDCRKVMSMYSQGAGYDEIARKLGLGSEEYAKRKKYLCKEALLEMIRKDPEYRDHLDLK